MTDLDNYLSRCFDEALRKVRLSAPSEEEELCACAKLLRDEPLQRSAASSTTHQS